MSRQARAARAAKKAMLLAHCAVSVGAIVMKPTTAVRQPLRRVTRRTEPQMMAFLPISSIPMIGKARRTTKLSVAIDPFTEAKQTTDSEQKNSSPINDYKDIMLFCDHHSQFVTYLKRSVESIDF